MSVSRRVALAMAMGWRVFTWFPHDPNDKSARVINPQGEEVHRELSHYDVDVNLARAWNYVPDIETDVAAGLAALDATEQTWQLTRLPTEKSLWVPEGVEMDANKRYRCSIGRSLSDIGKGPAICYGATPAEALCAALASYYGVEAI